MPQIQLIQSASIVWRWICLPVLGLCLPVCCCCPPVQHAKSHCLSDCLFIDFQIDIRPIRLFLSTSLVKCYNKILSFAFVLCQSPRLYGTVNWRPHLIRVALLSNASSTLDSQCPIRLLSADRELLYRVQVSNNMAPLMQNSIQWPKTVQYTP